VLAHGGFCFGASKTSGTRKQASAQLTAMSGSLSV